jgi:hypothetical protein
MPRRTTCKKLSALPALLLALVLAGCAAPAPIPGPTSGIFGVATIGPTCPVERNPPDPACADRPYQGELAVTSPDGASVVERFSSGSDGNFSVSVGPGEYAIRSAQPRPACSSATTLTVHPGAWTMANVTCDSGIR